MKVLAGSIVAIDALPLLVSTSQVVMLPLCGGFLVKSVAPGLVRRVSSILPLGSVIGVTLICGSIVARTSFSSFGPLLVLGIALLHALGGLIGFGAAKACKLPTTACRTVSIEVMMQNSSLAVALALAHFASPLVAVPGAISATMVRFRATLWACPPSGSDRTVPDALLFYSNARVNSTATPFLYRYSRSTL